MRRDSFERFYYEKVSLEGCGCAEYVTTRLRARRARRQGRGAWVGSG